MHHKSTNNKSNLSQHVYDVIIAGGGPVGLFLACELALAKCSVLVLEKNSLPQSPLKQLPFGIRGLSAPTVEALYRRGLLDLLELHKRLKNPHQNAQQGERRQVGHFAGIPIHHGDIDLSRFEYRLPGSTSPSLLSEMAELENVFTQRAEELGVKIKRDIELTGFTQTADDVIVQSANGTFQGMWLVGCDGGKSVIRKVGEFDFPGTEPEFTGYTVMIDLADPKKLKPGRNVTANGMYLQSQPGYVIIQDFDCGRFHKSKNLVTLEHLQHVLRHVSETNVTVTALHLATTWTDGARQVNEYRKGRVLLAGDAAHIHSPLGGQGLNLGLGDAMNLGWKLAAVVNNIAPDAMLDTYFTERHPIGAQVLDWSRAQVAVMTPNIQARALRTILTDLLNTTDGATYIAKRIWGLDYRYNVSEDHPLAGRSVPNFTFSDGSTIGELMHDGVGIVLDFDGTKEAQDIASNYHLKYISMPAIENFNISVMLIRPDGVVAGAINTGDKNSSLRTAAERWFTQ